MFVLTEFDSDVGDFSDDSLKDPDYVLDEEREVMEHHEEIEQPIGANEVTDDIGCNVNIRSARQKLRNSGKSYQTSSGNVIKKRVCIQFDNCRNRCKTKVDFNSCQRLFDYYWSLGSYEKRVLYIASLMNINDKKCDTLVNAMQRKRNRTNTTEYTLKIDGICTKVCRKHFQQCFGETDSYIKSVIKKQIYCPTLPLHLRGKSTPTNKISLDKVEEIKRQINKFPAYESHYSRRHTSQKYLHSDLNLTSMYKLYSEEVEDPVSLTKYSEVFHEMGLKFKSPKVDTCNTCDTLQLKIKQSDNDNDRSRFVKLKTDHVEKADKAYEHKRSDKNEAKNNDHIEAFTFDLQQCLPTPFFRTSVAFYKRQLWTFNLTVHDLKNDHSKCFMWHEAMAKRGGNEIASCVYKQLNMIGKNITEIRFYSDSCVGQNKNSFVSSMFIMYIQENPHIKYIDHKFLEPGHTHMECDSDHGLIERKKKNSSVNIQVPRDWYQLVNSVNKKMQSIPMCSSDFFNFSELSKSKFNFKRCNEDGEKFIWNEVRWVRYTKDCNSILYKKSLDIEIPFKILKICKRGAKSINSKDLNIIREIPRISAAKKKDLMDMKELINSEFHSFYENLISDEDALNIHPDLVDEEQVEDQNEEN